MLTFIKTPGGYIAAGDMLIIVRKCSRGKTKLTIAVPRKTTVKSGRLPPDGVYVVTDYEAKRSLKQSEEPNDENY